MILLNDLKSSIIRMNGMQYVMREIVRKITVFMVLCVCAVFLSSVSAVAQSYETNKSQFTDILENYRTDLPDVEPVAAEELDTVSDVFEATPFDEEVLGYKIRIPKGWENSLKHAPDDGDLSNKVLGDLAKFYGPPKVFSKRSYLSIKAGNLEYEMSVEHWVLKYLLSRGLTPKGMEITDRKRAEFFFVEVDGDTTYGVRAVAQVNGKRVILALYYLPLPSWEEEKNIQASAVQSLSVLTPIEEDVEEMVEYRFLDVARLRYPDSWKLKAPTIRTIDKMKIQILNYNQRSAYRRPILDGKIESLLHSYYAFESIEGERETLMKEVSKAGLIIGEQISSPEDDLNVYFKNHEDFDEYKLEIFKARNDENKLLNYEFWVTSFESGDYFYFFTLLTPARDDDFFTWSRNKEAYALVMKSFDPNLEGLLYVE